MTMKPLGKCNHHIYARVEGTAERCNIFSTAAINHRANFVFFFKYLCSVKNANKQGAECTAPHFHIIWVGQGKNPPTDSICKPFHTFISQKSSSDLESFHHTITLMWKVTACLLWSRDYMTENNTEAKQSPFANLKSQTVTFETRWSLIFWSLFFSSREGAALSYQQIFCFPSVSCFCFCLPVSPLIAQLHHVCLKIQFL